MYRDIGQDFPLISVFMPTHNRRALLERAVDSVLNQTYPNIELLIVDDGSSDNTWSYLFSIDDPRVRIFSNNIPKGACSARNRAISEASGHLITGIDDDDYFRPERMMDLWRGYDYKNSFTFSKAINFRHFLLAPLVFFRNSVTLSQLFNYNLIGSQCITETYKILEVKGFDENLPALQDYDLWVRLVQNFGDAKLIYSDTYVVDVGHGEERITNPNNRIRAYAIFLAKYKEYMSPANLNSLYLREAEWSGGSVSWAMVVRASLDGNLRWALRFVFNKYFR